MSIDIVSHSSLSDFLQTVATQEYDDVRLNLLVGPLVEVWAVYPSGDVPTQVTQDAVPVKPDAKTKIFVSVWVGHELRLVFTKFGAGQSRIASPLLPSQLGSLAVPLLSRLVSHLLQLAIFSDPPNGSPELLRTLAGPQPLVRPFLALWPHPSSTTPGLDIHACSVRVPPPASSASLPQGHTLSLLDSSNVPREDLDDLARLVIGFLSNAPSSSRALTLEQARKRVEDPHSTMWVYRAPRPPPLPASHDEREREQERARVEVGVGVGAAARSSSSIRPVGFVLLGRPTLRTIAIRGVMVSPELRARGIAQRMVANVVRTYLVDAPPGVVEYNFLNETTVAVRTNPSIGIDRETVLYGRKEEVCLFVEVGNGTARRLYRRLGFEESEDRWGDFDLEGVEPGSW